MKSVYFLTAIASIILQANLSAQSNNYQNSTEWNASVQSLPSNQEKVTPNSSDPYAAPKPDELRSNQKIERTLAILKPDALKNRHVGDIISRFEDAGLRVAAIKMIKLNPNQTSQFYAIHRDQPFFADLVKYISAGPVIVLVLEGNQAITKNRQLIGATDPKKAEKGTIRADFATSISENAIHGSDSPDTARQEISFFFEPNEIYSGY